MAQEQTAIRERQKTRLEAIIISNLNQLILAAPEHALISKVTSTWNT